MITGYNTDVRRGDLVFHVQTEDKGLANPTIESLVYVKGQVLGAKRVSYSELLAEGADEKAVVSLMDRQHRLMIAAIRSGRFDDKAEALFGVRPTAAEAAATATITPSAVTATGERPARPPIPPPILPSGRPGHGPPMEVREGGPPAAAEPGAATAGSLERSLDQVILDYLSSEADQEQLVLSLAAEGEFGLGKSAVLRLRASSSKTGGPVAAAQVSVKMISTVAEPSTLASGRTDAAGEARLPVVIPGIRQGTAALIVTVASPIGQAEIKHLL